MKNILATISHLIGSSAVAKFLEMEAIELAHQHRDTIERAFTIPEADLAALCAKTGANLEAQRSANLAFAQAAADFLLGFTEGPSGG